MKLSEDELARLSAYLDGDLDAGQGAEVKAWIEATPAAEAALAALKDTKSTLQASEQFPIGELWPAIAAKVPALRAPPRRPAWRRSLATVALAAAVALAFVWGRRSASVVPETNQPNHIASPNGGSLAVTLNSARLAYEAAIDDLGAEALKTQDKLPNESRQQLAQSLAAVDEALRVTQAAVSRAPNDPMAHETLLALYEEKVRVLGAAIAAADLGGGAL